MYVWRARDRVINPNETKENGAPCLLKGRGARIAPPAPAPPTTTTTHKPTSCRRRCSHYIDSVAGGTHGNVLHSLRWKKIPD